MKKLNLLYCSNTVFRRFSLLLLLCFIIEGKAQDSESLINKYKTIGNKSGAVSEYFSQSEINSLRSILEDKKGQSEQFKNTPNAPIAHGYESMEKKLSNFEISNPAIINYNGNVSDRFGEAAGAISFQNPNIGYATDADGNLYKIDVPTGVYSMLGNLSGDYYNGMSFNPVDNKLYGITNTLLFEINLQTLTSRLIGPLVGINLAIALAIDGQGNAYTYDIISDKLYSIDLITANTIEIGDIGFNANYAQGMDWDPSTDTVYMAAFNNDTFRGEWRSVNLTTGMTSFLGNIGGNTDTNLTWVSIPFTGTLNVNESDHKNIIDFYPNPTSSFLFINSSLPIANVDIYKITGELVRKGIPDFKKVYIGDLSSGSYIFLINFKNGSTKSAKILKK